MANAPDTSTYILASSDSTDLPNSRTLTEGTGINLLTTDPTNQSLKIQPTNNLLTLSTYDTTGFVTYNGLFNTFSARTLSGSSTIGITNTDGASGNSIFSVTPYSSIQQVQILNNGTLSSTRSILNLIGGTNVSISVIDNTADSRADITFSTTGAAPTTATYITQTPDSSLTSEQALSTLSTGILKSTTGTGVISIATAAVDYLVPDQLYTDLAEMSPLLGRNLVFSPDAQNLVPLDPGPSGTVLKTSGTYPYWTTDFGTVTSVGITSTGGGSITVSGSPVTTSGTITVNLTPTGITAGSYTNADITVNAYGFITDISDGDSGLTWNILTTTSPTITDVVANNGYIASSSGTVLMALPVGSSSTVGDTYTVTLLNGTGWSISTNDPDDNIIYNGVARPGLQTTSVGGSATIVFVGENGSNGNFEVISYAGTISQFG